MDSCKEILPDSTNRRSFIGGSDARIIVGKDEAALLRLWREKRGETEPEDLSGNLIVQLGAVTKELNRRWYEANTGLVITDVQKHIRRPGLRWMAALRLNAQIKSFWRNKHPVSILEATRLNAIEPDRESLTERCARLRCGADEVRNHGAAGFDDTVAHPAIRRGERARIGPRCPSSEDDIISIVASTRGEHNA